MKEFIFSSILFFFTGSNFASQPLDTSENQADLKEKIEVAFIEGTIVGLTDSSAETLKLIVVLDGDKEQRFIKTGYSTAQLIKIQKELQNPAISKKIIFVVTKALGRNDIILSDPTLRAIVDVRPTKTADTSCGCSVQ